jgi:hypothetical protein
MADFGVGAACFAQRAPARQPHPTPVFDIEFRQLVWI